MRLDQTITIPLHLAFMCADDRGPHIGSNPHTCPACGSDVVSLKRILDRQTKETQCTN